MALTRRLHLTLLTISTLLLIHAHLAATTTKPWVDTLPSYAAPERFAWMHSIVVDPDGDVFVGGRNVLFHFSPDLELKEMVITGPVTDYPDCFYPFRTCTPSKDATDFTVEVLQLVYNLDSRPCLLVCGSSYRIFCQIRPVDNITEYHWVHPVNHSVGYTKTVSNTYSYFGPGYDDQQTLITMISDTKDNYFAPFLSSKVVEKVDDGYNIRYSFQNETAKSALEFSTWTNRFVKDGGLVHDGFVYFLITSLQESINDYDTRLVRVCTHDGTFQSISELPISCDQPTSRIRTYGLAFHINDSPSSDAKSLYVTFIKNYGQHPGTGLCIFPMTDVIHAFTAFPRKCLHAVGHSCEQEMKTDITDFCGSDVSPYVVSEPLIGSLFKFLPKTQASGITTVKNNNEMVAVVGDETGNVQKVSLTSGKIISKNNIFKNSFIVSFMRNPFVFDRDHQHIYLMKENKIVKFPVASCRVHETCESCFTEGRNDPLICGWCGGYCAHSTECEDSGLFSRDTCTPSISEVSPEKGTLQGAVEVKIIGNNFGSYVVDGLYSITVAGIPCELTNWTNKEITCMLGPSAEETSGPVELNATISNSSSIGYNVVGSTIGQLNFSYYSGPRLFGVHPNKGPTSGGTNVSLFGENLDFESNKYRYFIVSGRLCYLNGFNKTVAWCVTGNEKISDHPDEIAIIVDGVTYMMEENPPPIFKQGYMYQSFEYIPDPEILQIQPGITTVSGLINVTVTGQYLDSVLSPRIVVKVSSSDSTNLEFIEKCWSDPESRGTKLTCRTPTVADHLRLQMPTRTSPLLTHVSFIMDGVQWVREFPQHQEFMSRLLYYPDPEFKPFSEIEKIADDQTSIEIKGSNLGLLNSVNNFHIRLGDNDSCNVTIVSMELLLCVLPPSLKNSSSTGTDTSVRVFMGSISRHLGYIKFIQVEKNRVVSVHLLVFYILIPFVVIVVAFLCFREIRKKKLLQKTTHQIAH